MRLTDIAIDERLTVVRDGEFKELGYAGWRAKEALIPLYDKRFSERVLQSPSLACLLTTPELVEDVPEEIPVAVSENPLELFLKIHMSLVGTGFYWSSATAKIHSTAEIHPTAFVEEHDVEIGARTVVSANAVILRGTKIGQDCLIGPGTVIGYDGFEVRTLDGRRQNIPHAGGVVLEDRVDVQANCSIAKSIFNAPTIVGEDTKIGHMAFISHGVVLGRSCRVAAHATVCGYTVVGDDVWIGPGAQVSNGLRIGDASFVTIGSVVIRDVDAGGRVTGNFAMDHALFMQNIMQIKRK